MTRKVTGLSRINGLSKKRLLEISKKAKDPRRSWGNKKHLLSDILVITLLAVICDCNSWQEIHDFAVFRHDWLKTFLELPNDIPSRVTFIRFFTFVKPDVLEDIYREWVRPFVGSLNSKHICIDGKTIRTASKFSGSPIHLLSAYVCENYLSIGQVKTANHSNEITAIPELLKAFDLTGATITIDAIGCQKSIAKLITDSHGHYILQVKDNQRTLREEVSEFLLWAPTDKIERKKLSRYTFCTKEHGRITRWKVLATQDVVWFESIKDWQHLHSFILVERITTKNEGTSSEISYYISSLQVNAKTFSKLIREHWRVENSLHWVLDVVFDEDHCRIHNQFAPQNLNILRKMAIALLRNNHSFDASLKRKQKFAAYNSDFLLSLFMD